MGKDPESLIEEAEQEKQNRGELAKEALQWFLDEEHIGEFYSRGDVAEDLANELDVSTSRANVAISDTVGDIVDPVQQISTRNTKYVGVIDYRVYSSEGAYGYIDFDDKKQKRKRVVCAKCVEEAEYDEEVVHATQGQGTSNEDATWDQLLNKTTAHYAESHTEGPSKIEPGATLLNGTTISGNVAFHAGNDGSGSNLNSDLLDGEDGKNVRTQTLKFGKPGSRTNSESYVAIPDSDIVIDFDDYKDSNGNVEIKIIAHLWNQGTTTTRLRLFRQNASTAVSGTELSFQPNTARRYGIVSTSYIDMSNESGLESYQIQLRTAANFDDAEYNSVIMKIR